MSTAEANEDTEPGPLLGLGSSDGLGPVPPKRDVISVVAEWAIAGHISEAGVTGEACQAIRAAVAGELAAERDRAGGLLLAHADRRRGAARATLLHMVDVICKS